MTEFKESTPPSEEDFNSFLAEINNMPEARFDTMAMISEVEENFQVVLSELEYEPIKEGGERALAEKEHILHAIMSTEAVDDVVANIAAENSIKLIAEEERLILLAIKSLAARCEFDILNDNDEGWLKATSIKAKLYTDLQLLHGVTPDNILMDIMNRTVPGPLIERNDPMLKPFYLASMHDAESGIKKERIINFITEACVFLEIGANYSPEDRDILTDGIAYLVFVGTIEEQSPNAAANHEELVRSVTQKFLFSPELTEKVLEII